MARWRPDARERLERAAVELFREQGFAATTVPEITARAGLTTRTFFRHFADKREVLFAADGEVPEIGVRTVVDAPPEDGPLDALVAGLRLIAGSRFEDRRDDLRERRDIVASDESLRERELHKWAAMRDAATQGLCARGVDRTEARLVAGAAVAAFEVALEAWLAPADDRPLTAHLDDCLAILRQALDVERT